MILLSVGLGRITASVFAFIAVIDSVDGFRKAWRTSRQAAPPVG